VWSDEPGSYFGPDWSYLCAVFAQEAGNQKRTLASWLQQYLHTRVMETKRLPKPELILGIGAGKTLPKLLKPVYSIENPVNKLVNLLTSRRKT